MLQSDVIQGDPDFVAIVTLSEPTPRVEEDSTGSSHNGQDSLKLNITNKGGSYTPITSDGVQIGSVFKSLITSLDNSSDIIGYTRGHSFIFPQDNFTSDVLGLSLNDHARDIGIQYMYLEGDNNDGTLTLIDENVVHATGDLLKYDGGKVSEWNIISTDPYAAEATISSAKDANNQEDDVVGPTSFRFTSEDGFWEPMMIGDNETMLGERFRDSVYDTETNTRIGTNSGFAFSFPTTLLPRWANPYIAIRNVYLDGGSIDVLNQVVVGASGIYKSYVGWTYDETIVSYNPVFTADIKLLDPSAEAETGEGAIGFELATPPPSSSIEEGNGGNSVEITADDPNPNPSAEQEIIEQVKDETSSTDEIVTPPTQPDSTDGDGVTNPTTTNPVDDSGSGRKLTSVVASFVFVAAGLGIF